MPETAEELGRRVAALEQEVRQLRRVQDCTASLIASLDRDETLRTILDTALDVAGARQGSVLLYEPGRTHLRIATAIGLREEVIAATRIPDGEGVSGKVARSGAPLLVEDTGADPRFRERRARAERSRSFASLPMAYRGETLGVMNLSHPADGGAFRPAALPLLTALAAQATVAIAHAEMHRSLLEKQRLEQQIGMAKAIQENFVPPVLHLTGGGYEFSGRNEPARTVGGDLYGVAGLSGGRHALFLGDVSGKGVPAALHMARLLSDVHHAIGVNPAPAAVLASLNSSLCRRGHRGMFVTMAYGVTTGEPGIVRMGLAGHHPPLLRSVEGPAFALSAPAAPPLGIRPGLACEEFDVDTGGGNLLLLYSDGAVEAAAPGGEEFGAARLARALREAGHSCAAVVDRLMAAVANLAPGAPPRDDITFLAARGLAERGDPPGDAPGAQGA